MVLVNSINGRKNYYLSTPLMERYELAKDPYMEFRYGIELITYDSLGAESSRLLADYAIYYERRELWEARGNVTATSSDGNRLFTQQLFWNQKTDQVYSNVDSRIESADDVFTGQGFQSDSSFREWEFRNTVGRVMVDVDEMTAEPEQDEVTSESELSDSDHQ